TVARRTSEGHPGESRHAFAGCSPERIARTCCRVMRVRLLLCLALLAGCAPSAPTATQAPPAVAAQPAQAGAAQKPPPAPGGGESAAVAPSPQGSSGPRSLKGRSLLSIGLAPLLVAQSSGYLKRRGLHAERVNLSH